MRKTSQQLVKKAMRKMYFRTFGSLCESIIDISPGNLDQATWGNPKFFFLDRLSAQPIPHLRLYHIETSQRVSSPN